MLLTLQEIQIQLNNIFIPLEEDMEDMNEYRLRVSQINNNDIIDFQSISNIILPKSFTELILLYDFNNLTLCNVQFGYSPDKNYLEYVLEINKSFFIDNFQKKIFIALSDPYSFSIELSTGKIIVSDDEIYSNSNLIIANNFKNFILALGNIFLLKKTIDRKVLLNEVCKLCDTDKMDFWSTMI